MGIVLSGDVQRRSFIKLQHLDLGPCFQYYVYEFYDVKDDFGPNSQFSEG